MCTPKAPKVDNTPAPVVAAPTLADAQTTKSSSSSDKKRALALSDRDVKTSARGLGDNYKTQKKELLGK